MAQAFTDLKSRLDDVTTLGQITALLDWDMQTKMPEGGSEARSRHLSTISKLIHAMFTAEETGKLLDETGPEVKNADYDSFEASFYRLARREYDRARKLPTDLVAEISRVGSLGHNIWAKARQDNDFKSFVPTLQKMVELKIKAAECIGYTDHIYDALLDEYEPGLKTADVAQLFAGLRKELVPLLKQISERVATVDDSPVHLEFDEEHQREFAEEVIKDFGFDFKRGRQDRTVHPFCTNFSINDVRITTRYEHNFLNPALFGTLHETGHALYELNVDQSLEGTMLAGGTSLGIHESQSRLWENIVGRSRGFWQHYFPRLQKYFPKQLENVDVEAFYRAINRVEPSFIRVEADEATYNMHIMVRFELEADLIAQKLRVNELPEAWNAKYKEYLGIVPPTDALGVLQDVHWSGGGIGYFPTYSIGTILSAQLYDKAVATHPQIPAELAQGKFDTLRNWLRDNVYQYGRKYEPKELIQRATGEPMQTRSYMKYLRTKFGDIYGIK